jgi:hypothetical protein
VDGHEVRLVPRSPPTAANPDRGVGDPQGRLLKYGYGLKGTSLLLFKAPAPANARRARSSKIGAASANTPANAAANAAPNPADFLTAATASVISAIAED